MWGCSKLEVPPNGYTGWWFGCHFLFSHILGFGYHPNWRTHIFQRGGPGPPTSMEMANTWQIYGSWWPLRVNHGWKKGGGFQLGKWGVPQASNGWFMSWKSHLWTDEWGYPGYFNENVPFWGFVSHDQNSHICWRWIIPFWFGWWKSWDIYQPLILIASFCWGCLERMCFFVWHLFIPSQLDRYCMGSSRFLL